MDVAVLETHYFSQNAWLNRGLLLKTAKRIPPTVPLYIVQGRFDFVCPPAIAVKLANTVKHSKLYLTDAGHSWTEPATEAQLKRCLKLM
jgi:proline iminopeptidase